MNNEALKRAQEGLSLLDIQQHKVDAWIDDDYEPRIDSNGEGVGFQTKKIVKSSSILALKEDEEHEEKFIYRVEIEFGVRYVSPDQEISKESDTEKEPKEREEEVLAQIEAIYRLDYIITKPELMDDKEALDEFSLYNAPHHAWSFWREFIDSQSNRMRLPRLTLPMLNRIQE